MRYKLDPLSPNGVSPEAETKIIQSTSHAMPGRDGINGVGVPSGGSTNQVLSKKSTTDYDTEWRTVSGTGGSGDVIGPASAVDGNLAAFDTTTGKLIKDSGSKVSDFATASHNHTGVYAPALGADDNYVTDAEKVKLANLSGTNTGDNATNSQYSGLAASKQDTLVSGTNIKTINSTSILGSGDIVISGGTGAVDSVNSKTGTVVLNQDDIGDGTTYKQYSSTEKTKLSGIAENANNYTHPATHSADIITDGTTNKAYTATEKTKLAGIATGAEVNVNADWNAVSGDAQILNKPTLGTAAAKNIPATGNASATEVVYGSDTRLTDARTPVTHAHAIGDITATGTPSSTTFLRGDGTWTAPSGSGDVVGPASSTNTGIARYNGTTGKIIQDSTLLLDTSGTTADLYSNVADTFNLYTGKTGAYFTLSGGTGGGVRIYGNTYIDTVKTDTIDEKTAASGVTIDGVKIKDGGLYGQQTLMDVKAKDATTGHGGYFRFIGGDTTDATGYGGGIFLKPGQGTADARDGKINFVNSSDGESGYSWGIKTSTLDGFYTIGLPNADGDIVLHSATQTLTNKTLTLPTITSSLAVPDTELAGVLRYYGGEMHYGNGSNSLTLANVSGTQTLTNKTISGASNTLSDIAQASVTNLTTDLASKVTGFADPNADRIVFWDDSAGAYAALTASTGLTISGTSMTVRSSSSTQTGIVELATDAETTTGTDTARAITPANLTSQIGTRIQAYDADLTTWGGKTAPSGTVVGTTDTQTLTNKTLSTGSTIDANVTVTEVLKKVYPVGSVYIATVATNPATLFGFGTWAAYGEGRVIVGKAAAGTFSTAGATGGAETVTLTAAQSGLPAHTHPPLGGTHYINYRGTGGGAGLGTGSNLDTYATTGSNTAANAAEAHSNLQPYIVAYTWTRTA